MTFALTARAGRIRFHFRPHAFFAALLGIETRKRHASAKATFAPAELGVEREQSGIELREARAARRTRTTCREHDGLRASSIIAQNTNDAFAVIHCSREQ